MEELKQNENMSFNDFVKEKCDNCTKNGMEKCDTSDKKIDIEQKYKDEIEENNEILKIYEDIICNLKRRNRICYEVLDAIKQMKGI